MTALAEVGAALLGGALVRARALGGGDLSQILRIELADGRVAIVKNGPAPRAEAEMLEKLAQAGAPAPRVLAASDEALVMAELPTGGSLRTAYGDLGAVLARLHATAGPHYGWHRDYAFGAVAILNAPADDWPAFWGERRLIACVPHVPVSIARRLERLAVDLPNRLPQRPKASLLHGDLWGGNVLVDGSRISGLVDPACYFGHGEVDIAMLTLFDTPPPAFFAAYGELPPGATERLAIYRLWPALVHLRLFGGSYRGLVEGILDGLKV